MTECVDGFGVSTVGEGYISMERGEARSSPEEVDWDWRYWCGLVMSSIRICKRIRMLLCIRAYMYTYVWKICVCICV